MWERVKYFVWFLQRRNLLNLRISGSNRLARIVKSDIVASNGVIHVTKKLLVGSLGEIGNLQVRVNMIKAFLDHLSRRLKVIYSDHSLSVVRRSLLALNIISS